MTVQVTVDKKEKLKQACRHLLRDGITLRQLVKVIGSMVANFLGVQYGQLFYRRCDNLKTQALKSRGGNYAVKLSLTRE